MGTTTNFALPYPAGSDSPAGHTQIQALADAVDAALPIRSAKKAIVAAEQTTSSPGTWELLGTPDRVTDITLPTDGLILVAYEALVKASTANTANRAAIFLDEDQLKAGTLPGTGFAQVIVTDGSDTVDRYRSIYTAGGGLVRDIQSASAAQVTTGQALGISGGICPIFAAAGTYDVSVRFNANGGATITAKNRKLWVASLAFS